MPSPAAHRCEPTERRHFTSRRKPDSQWAVGRSGELERTKEVYTRFHLARFIAVALAAPALAQIPTEVQMPGTQPEQIPNNQDSNSCNNCHGNYAPTVEPWRMWLGGAMPHATRDPLLWATAISEHDFPGAGDLCLRCHTPLRSPRRRPAITPTALRARSRPSRATFCP